MSYAKPNRLGSLHGSALLLTLIGWLLLPSCAGAATLTVQTNVLGSTPSIIGCNLGHFYTGSNTRDWWRYLGVNGARIFILPSQIESATTIANAAGLVGVSNQTSFLTARAAMHTNQFNPNFINWSSITNNYNNNDLSPPNHVLVNSALTALSGLGVQACAQISASQSTFPISDTNDWTDGWGLWHHYYAQAFYLSRYFGVQRFEIYNEPNGSAANGLTPTNFLFRLQLAADAITNALSDVNQLYGRALTPIILAPTVAGGATGHYSDWGRAVVTNRHQNFLGQTNSNYLLFQKYDYHEYDSTPAGFGANLATLTGNLQTTMTPETPLPCAISEFNTHTAANFDALTNTLDTPAEYASFGAICNELMASQISEMYCFKFSQVSYAGTYPVQKNALCYVDNTNAPYNVGGITKAGEVFRLFTKAFAAGRSRLSVSESSGAANLETHASFNPLTRRNYLFSANNTAAAVSLNLDLSALNLPATNRVLLEEVSETNYGTGMLWTNLPTNGIINATQNFNTVWLLTAPARPQQPEQIIAATDDAQVCDGANRGVNYGVVPAMIVRNDPASAANRSVALMKFHLPVTNFNALEFALLSVPAACATSNGIAQAHVYFLNSTNWSQASVTWSSAPNLKQNSAAGSNVANSVILGVGSTASIVGQLVVTTTNISEKLIDLTDFLRSQTNQDFSILVVQDPRWDITLPVLTAGDVQPDGVKIATTESGTGPRLVLVLASVDLAVAVNDAYDAIQNTALSVAAPGVLTNDAFATGAVLATGPAHGTITFSANGGFIYQPATNYTGADSFTYLATNSAGASSPATVTLMVHPPIYWADVPVIAEAFVRGGASANTDQDEAATGYVMVKYDVSPFDNARKAYFQFDLTGMNLNTSTQAVFTINFLNSNQQNVQLWSLNQPYTNFTSTVMWNAVTANDTGSDNLLTNGPYTATPIGSFTNIPVSGTLPQGFILSPLSNFIQGNRVTLALTGVINQGIYVNNTGGLRILRTNAVLTVLVVTPGAAANPPKVTGVSPGGGGRLVLSFSGAANQQVRVQAVTNLATPNWQDVVTNFFNASGGWSWTNFDATNFSNRFYRAVSP